MPRLTRSDETALRTKLEAGTASLLEENLLGEVVHLRKACFAYAERLAVAYPEQAQRGDFAAEYTSIVASPTCAIHGNTCHPVWHKADNIAPMTALEERAQDGDR